MTDLFKESHFTYYSDDGIYHAIYKNDYDKVRSLLTPKNINKPILIQVMYNNFEIHMRPLALAVYYNHIKIIKLLLECHAEINYKNDNNLQLFVPFLETCFRGDLKLVKLFIKYGADILYNYDDNHPIDLAIHNKKDNVVKFLIKKNTKVLDHYNKQKYKLFKFNLNLKD